MLLGEINKVEDVIIEWIEIVREHLYQSSVIVVTPIIKFICSVPDNPIDGG